MLVASGIAVLLAGCAAGQVASTAEVVPVVDGALATVSTMDLRAVAIAPPTDRSWAEGSTAPLQMFLINNSATPDQLVKVSSDRSSSVQVLAHGGVEASSPAAPGGQQSQSIDVPGDESVSVGFDPGNPQVVLTGLTENLFPAQTVTITFQFAKAGSVTTRVPVRLTSPPSSPPIINTTPTEEG
jgi:copper(I)-binding protein